MAPRSPTNPGKRRKSGAGETLRRRSSIKLPPTSPSTRQSRSSSSKSIKPESPSATLEPASAFQEAPSSSALTGPIGDGRRPTPPWMYQKSWDFGPKAFAGSITPGRYKGRKRSSGISPKGRAALEGRSTRRSSEKSPRKSVTFDDARSRSRSFEPGSPPAEVGGRVGAFPPALPQGEARSKSLSPSEGVYEPLAPMTKGSLGSSSVAATSERKVSGPKSPPAQRKSVTFQSSKRAKTALPTSPMPPQAVVTARSLESERSQVLPLQLERRASTPCARTSPLAKASTESSLVASTSPSHVSIRSKSGSKSLASPERSGAGSRKASVYSPTSPPVPNARLPTYSPIRPIIGMGIGARQASAARFPRRLSRSPGLNAHLRSPGVYAADDEREEGELDEPTPTTLHQKRLKYYSSSGSGSKSKSRSRSRSRSIVQTPPTYPCVGFQRRSSLLTPSPPVASSSSPSSKSSDLEPPNSPLGQLFRVISEVWDRRSSRQGSSASNDDLFRHEEIYNSLFHHASNGYRALLQHVERLLETHEVHDLLAILARQGLGRLDGVLGTQWRFALRHVGEPQDSGAQEIDADVAVAVTRMLLDEVEGLAGEIPRRSWDEAVARWEGVLERFLGEDKGDGLRLGQDGRLDFEDAIYEFVQAEGFCAFVDIFQETHPGEAAWLFANILEPQIGTATPALLAPADRHYARAIVGVILGDEEVEPLRANIAGETIEASVWELEVKQEIDWLSDDFETAAEFTIRDTDSEVEALADIEDQVANPGESWRTIFRMLREHIRIYGLETLIRQVFADLNADVVEALRRDARTAVLELGRLTPERYDPEDNIAALIADEMVWRGRERRGAPFPTNLVGNWEPPRAGDGNNWARSVSGDLRRVNADLVAQLRERSRELAQAQREVEQGYDQEYFLQQRVADLEGVVERLRVRRRASEDSHEPDARCRVCNRAFYPDEEGWADLDVHYEWHRRTCQEYALLESQGWLDAFNDLDLTPAFGARRRSSPSASPSSFGSRRSSVKRRRSGDDEQEIGRRGSSFATEKKRRRRATEVLVPRRSGGGSVESLRGGKESLRRADLAVGKMEEMKDAGGLEEEAKEEAEEEEVVVQVAKPVGVRRSSRIAAKMQKGKVGK